MFSLACLIPLLSRTHVLLCALVHVSMYFFFLMIRRPPRSTLDRSSAASDVYKRQGLPRASHTQQFVGDHQHGAGRDRRVGDVEGGEIPVSYTHLRAHETVLDLVCRLLLEKKKTSITLNTNNIVLTSNRNITNHQRVADVIYILSSKHEYADK